MQNVENELMANNIEGPGAEGIAKVEDSVDVRKENTR